MKFFTIGVYNSSEKDFFKKLTDNKIDTFIDIRQRRGVRGSEYSFVNSKSLQKKLSDLNIKYRHILELAPTEEIRQVQVKADKMKSVAYRKRQVLDKTFALEYATKILKNFNLNEFIKNVQYDGAQRIVLFCVEQNPDACHRSIVANELMDEYKFKVKHL